MLDEDEYQGIMAIWEACFHRGPDHPNTIGHHRISIYGPPCLACGKPLRTPQARSCAACGAKVEASGSST